MKSFIFLTFIVYLSITKAEWVDPHSMDTKSKHKIPTRSESLDLETRKRYNSGKTHCEADLHLKRIVRLILSNAYLDDLVGYHEGYLNIKLTTHELQFLMNFSQSSDIGDNTISEISSIFENALQKTTYDRYEGIVLSTQEKLYYLIFNPTSGALGATCIFLFIIYKLLRAQFTWKSIVKYFVFLMYIMDFTVTYLSILHEEEIDNFVALKKMGTVPPECDPKNMSWGNYFQTQLQSIFWENPCKAYYKITYQNLKYFVAPSKVLTKQFRTLIVEPGGDIGEAFGKFGRGMFTKLPWGLNVVLFPIMLITSCVFIFIIFLFITKPHFKLSLFHLFSIELGQPVRHEVPTLRGNDTNTRQIAGARRRRVRNQGREFKFW
ncbi:uncharacterized protein LOC123016007 isoform X2 [Tribolium madens]|uniref:uncharacterized protein LOC123016007 isoform X2 n=1 Tax=Tribolium madens TaxID=41895 RepID=UPI001CF74532|nr:uncharacterized protein LOC123016007 isoform X2 [Tribolium madens]